MIGEHSDWSASYKSEEHKHIHPGACLAYNTDCGITLEGRVEFVEEGEVQEQQNQAKCILEYEFHPLYDQNNTNNKNRSEEPVSSSLSDSTSIRVKRIPFTLRHLTDVATAEGDFFAHVCGTCAEVLTRIGGEEEFVKALLVVKREAGTNFSNGNENSTSTSIILIKITCSSMTLPMKKGLSSSAAVGVGLAQLLGQLCSVDFTTSDLMDIAYCGEHRTGSKCGRLDQCVAFGPKSFIKLDFQGGPQLPICTPVQRNSSSAFYFVVCDLNASKNTRVILRDLNSAFPVPHSDVDRNVHEALGPHNLRLVQKAEEALSSGDSVLLGSIFTEAQEIFDKMIAPKCLSELAAPKLHRVLEHAEVKKLSLGGKGVGSQGDGSAQFVCRNKEDQDRLCDVLMSEELNCTPLKFCLVP